MINDARRLRRWITTEVDQLLAGSWRSDSGSWNFAKSGSNDVHELDHERVRAQLELLARLAVEAGDHATPARMEREWTARYREYRARGGPSRYMMLLIDEVREIDRERFAITQPCPVCGELPEHFCRYSDGSSMDGFHRERYELPDRFGITRDCPACHAPAGDPCRTSGGNVRADTHASRKGDQRADVRVAAVACPVCHAAPGQPCRTASRKIATAMHGERRLAERGAHRRGSDDRG